MSLMKVPYPVYLLSDKCKTITISYFCKASYCSKIEETLANIVKQQTKTEIKNVRVPSEKEKDAVVRSILIKEYKKMTHTPVRLPSIDANAVLMADVSKHETAKNEIPENEASKDETPSTADSKVGFTQQVAQEMPKPSPERGPVSPGGESGDGKLKRLVRREPGKVLFCVIPIEWWQFFMPKTGVSGLYTFFVTFGTFLISKEYYVLEHNYYNGLSMALVCAFCVKSLGKQIAAYLDKGIDEMENECNASRNDEKKHLNAQLDNEKYLQWSAKGQLMLVEAKRSNVDLQLEAEFRQRQMNVYQTIIKRLEYQVEIQFVKRRYAHMNLVQWVMKEVRKNISPELTAQYNNMCFKEVELLIQKLSELEK